MQIGKSTMQTNNFGWVKVLDWKFLCKLEFMFLILNVWVQNWKLYRNAIFMHFIKTRMHMKYLKNLSHLTFPHSTFIRKLLHHEIFSNRAWTFFEKFRARKMCEKWKKFSAVFPFFEMMTLENSVQHSESLLKGAGFKRCCRWENIAGGCWTSVKKLFSAWKFFNDSIWFLHFSVHHEWKFGIFRIS